jgi:hypothetical protein
MSCDDFGRTLTARCAPVNGCGKESDPANWMVSPVIEYNEFIYLDVYRTGSTHVFRLFDEVVNHKPVKAFRHASLTKGRPLGMTGGKTVFATVRNPWDWYVSLWAYGSDGKSAIRRHLSPHVGGEDMAALYDRDDPKASFSRWLNMMHDPAELNRVMKEHLPESGLAPVIGLYTYRFLRVTTRWPRLLLRKPFVSGPDGAVEHHARFKAYGTLMRNESLTDDLVAFAERFPGSFTPDAVKTIRAADEKPRNTSSRSLKSYRDYYSDADAALVAERDAFFVKEFGYRF